MSAKAFIDTNIFIHAQRTDNPEKRAIAEDAIGYFDCIASTQVLKEIAHVFTKKYPVPAKKLELLLKSICEISEIIVIDQALIFHALRLHNRYKTPFYDSLMVAAAIFAGCRLMISEDMQDGMFFERKVKIVNIFNHTDLLTLK